MLGRMLIRTETVLQSDIKLLQSVVHELGLEMLNRRTTPGIKDETDPLSKPLSHDEHLPGQG
jgi:hypothetical protein